MQKETDPARLIRALIVDDEEGAREIMERLLLRIPGVEIAGKASSADEALEMAVNCQPDIVFLDVRMPEKNGFQLADYLQKYMFNTTVVFVTAHAEFAINAVKISAFDYLLKPVMMAELQETILRFKASRLQQNFPGDPSRTAGVPSPTSKIKFNTRTGYILIAPSDIMYCEADVNYTTIYLGKNRREVVTINLGKIEEILSPYSFHRVSRSIIINQACLSKADRQKQQCTLEKGEEQIILEISPNHIRELEKFLDT